MNRWFLVCSRFEHCVVDVGVKLGAQLNAQFWV